MPYIKKEMRKLLDIGKAGKLVRKSGELNYIITQICMSYYKNKEECYQTYNDIIGALECAKMEMYRRKISLYEIKKCNENGDVY